MEILSIQEAVKANNSGMIGLTTTTQDLTLFPPPLASALASLYADNSITCRVLGTIINAAVTQKTLGFFFSRRVLDALLIADGKPSLSGTDFRRINAYFFTQKILVVSRPYIDGKRLAKVVVLSENLRNEIKAYFPEVTQAEWDAPYTAALAAYDKKADELTPKKVLTTTTKGNQ